MHKQVIQHLSIIVHVVPFSIQDNEGPPVTGGSRGGHPLV